MKTSAGARLRTRALDSVEPEVLARLARIEQEAFGEGGLHNEWLLAPFIRYGKVYIAEYDDNIVGCAQFMSIWGSEGAVYCYGISISADYRGKGLGTIFLEQILNSLKAEGIGKVVLSVSPQNHSAVHLYEDKFGFIRVAFKPDEYGPGEDRLIMERQLCP